MAEFKFTITNQDAASPARAGIIHTRAGDIKTPHFVPVGTLASVRALDSADLDALGAQCALVNTYHLHLKPGDKLIKKLGGTHRFMNCALPLFSDSGGFQAFSLGLAREHEVGKIGFFPDEIRGGQTSTKVGGSGEKNLTKITDNGIEFRSIYDGSKHFFDAAKSMEIQANLGSDIIMAFDECTSPLSDYDYTKTAMVRTHDWARQSLERYDKDQAIYGIIQGGYFRDLRDESTKAIAAMPFDGIAIGGSLGKTKADMHRILEWVIPQLDERPRHLLGIGEIDDIFECVQRGIDTFDCVGPTRIARRANLYILPGSGGTKKNKFRINIGGAKYAADPTPIDENCECPTCNNYSRAYLRHLYLARELSYFRLATMHNLWFVLRLMENIRESIKEGSFAELKGKWLG
ncbi:MAG: tRNA guanosine(34) transglycosylase Tgt [Candidatus Pacebacteria bacterium]|jgi:tRNA-guanine transglycosylase|nr:tRNA guanosine(34) transglycosylase Tgt [Candidatus Paceibacterota bacterium]